MSKFNAALSAFAFLVLISLFVAIHGRAQTSSQETGSVSPQSANTQLRLYRHFFLYVDHLNKVADQRASAGEDGTPVRDYLRNKIGLSAADWSIVTATAEATALKLASLDAQARGIADADHQAIRSGTLTRGAPPPGLPKLKQLEIQRTQVLADAVTEMDAHLGSDAIASVKQYVTTTIAKGVRTTPLTPASIQAMRAAKTGVE